MYSLVYDFVMSNWGVENHEQLFDGVRLIRAERGPCPVCGHPTGDCAGSAEPPKRVVGLGTIPSMRKQQTVYVDRDVIEEVEISKGIVTKIIRARAGTQIPVDLAVELGIIEEPRDVSK